MTDKELIKVLKGKAVGRSCSICEYHRTCGPGGCNAYQEAADRIEELLAERNSLAHTLGKRQEDKEIIRRVSRKEAWRILESGEETGVYSPKGSFWCKDGGRYVGIDNRTGDAWTEDFATLSACLNWLIDGIVH